MKSSPAHRASDGLFSLSVQDEAGRGHVCYSVTGRHDEKQGDLPAVLFATKIALCK